MKLFRNNRGAMNLGESLALKAVSLLLALILWITILGLKQEELTINVKFSPSLALNMAIINPIPDSIQFVFSGPRVLLKDLEKKLIPISPNLEKMKETTIPIGISEKLIGELPAGVRVLSFSPRQFVIRLEAIIERFVTVEPVLRGEPAGNREVKQIKVTPRKVAVSGPRSFVEALQFVETEVIDISELDDKKEGVYTVELDSGKLALSRDKVVRVEIQTKPKEQ